MGTEDENVDVIHVQDNMRFYITLFSGHDSFCCHDLYFATRYLRFRWIQHLLCRQSLCRFHGKDPGKDDSYNATGDLPDEYGNKQIWLKVYIKGDEVAQAVTATCQEGKAGHFVLGTHVFDEGKECQPVR